MQPGQLARHDDPTTIADVTSSVQEHETPLALDRLLLALNPALPAASSAKYPAVAVRSLEEPLLSLPEHKNQQRIASPMMNMGEESSDATQPEPIASGNVDPSEQETLSGRTYESAAAAVSGVASLCFWTASQAFERKARTGDVSMLAPSPKKKPRIDAFDSLRFFLIAYIASGHFIHTATKSTLVLSLISQINVVVGAFFVLSGYVAAYTTTELGERKYNAARLDNPVQFTVSRVMGFWPLHMLVLAIFCPMFFWVDAAYKGPIVAAWHGLLSSSLMSAWFPLSAEVWNAPTWFLSALTFCLMCLSYALKVLAVQSKAQLRRTLVILGGLSFIPRLAYSYDLNAWGIMEGMLNARTHPNYALFNSLRFSPLGALLEVLMGAAACRLVMLDSDKETKETGSSILPLVGMIGVLVLRATGLIAVNDMIVRSLIFLPLFIKFLMRLHRESVGPDGSNKLIPKFLNLGIFKWLGGISFPIFIVHGPLGQLFYKKAVATKLFGGSLARIPGFFGVYWAAVIAFAWILNKFFVQNKGVQGVSKNITNAICNKLNPPEEATS
jgi:peptidoglycan/LPS O-acetylase OafA/YrhL